MNEMNEKIGTMQINHFVPKGEQNFYLHGSSQRAISKWVEI